MTKSTFAATGTAFLEDEMFAEMMDSESTEVEATGVKAEPLFAKKAKKKPVPKDKIGFKKLTGVESHSKIDHPVTCYKASDWDETIRQYIPSVKDFENYVAQPRELELLLVAWEMGDKTNVVGPTGSGKSSMVEYACALTGRPFIRINGRGDMESSALLGQLTAADGATKWSDGELTLGVRQGAVVCIDEWTLIPPEILMSLQWLMEDKGRLLLTDMPAGAGDRLVTPHKGFRMVCTDNTRGLGDETGGFAATNVQNTATLDRFGTIIHVGYLSEVHEAQVLKKAFPELQKEMVKRMLKFADLVRTGYEQGDISLTCSPRTLLNWAKKTLYFQDPAVALNMAFTEKLSSDGDRQAVSGMYRTAFDSELNL
jgi:cobaltochelatase CobS